jgi:hypothetical protein
MQYGKIPVFYFIYSTKQIFLIKKKNLSEYVYESTYLDLLQFRFNAFIFKLCLYIMLIHN